MVLSNIANIPSLGDPLEDAKRAAAYTAVDDNFDPFVHKIIGIGSGSTVVYVAERLGQLAKSNKCDLDFICIPTGFQSKHLILDNSLTLGSIEQHPSIDITFDGADEVDPQLQVIKGGGACLFQEKLVSTSSGKFIIVADSRKKSTKFLGTNWKKGVPIEVVPSSYVRVLNDLRKNYVCVNASLRQGGSIKAGPIITDNGNFIIDADFGEIENPKTLHQEIKLLLGVVETGLFIDNADKAYFCDPEGTVEIIERKMR